MKINPKVFAIPILTAATQNFVFENIPLFKIFVNI